MLETWVLVEYVTAPDDSCDVREVQRFDDYFAALAAADQQRREHAEWVESERRDDWTFSPWLTEYEVITLGDWLNEIAS